MQRLVKIVQSLLPWVLAAVILFTISGRPATAQQSAIPRTLAVTGYGQDPATTTLAQITLGLSDKGNSAKAAHKILDQRSSALVSLLKSKNVTRVKTSNINLNLKFDRDGKPQKEGFEGYQNIEFQVPVDKIGVLDDAIATDIDHISTIQYLASEQDILTARDNAIKEAIADAQTQAKVALDPLGFAIQEVIDIQVNDAVVQAPGTDVVPKGDSYSGNRWSGNPTVAEGEQGVEVKVTLKVRY
ncbi:MAG: SIMPL domain-containing protein [Cyanobacteria bacterium P01_F01_bin.13]